ncbi:basic salivary proline-rich protein 1-like [Hippopotamus amphibius kiboko]|uniref:basic salivary proline-rich protein 1-like n=1 Tax=Hippopotamus amphibius kiboko TaxID=575201 RepID=UPI002595BF80|nr:basic salivary proline-rich protein 1-like [Hippopotamus amphibius kiboko]
MPDGHKHQSVLINRTYRVTDPAALYRKVKGKPPSSPRDPERPWARGAHSTLSGGPRRPTPPEGARWGSGRPMRDPRGCYPGTASAHPDGSDVPAAGPGAGGGDPPPRAPEPRAAQPRARASLPAPCVHRACEQVTESPDPARTSSHPGPPRPQARPLPRSGPGRPRGAGRGLGRGDAPPAAAAAAGSRGGERARRAPPGRRREALLSLPQPQPPPPPPPRLRVSELHGRGSRAAAAAGPLAPAGGRLLARPGTRTLRAVQADGPPDHPAFLGGTDTRAPRPPPLRWAAGDARRGPAGGTGSGRAAGRGRGCLEENWAEEKPEDAGLPAEVPLKLSVGAAGNLPPLSGADPCSARCHPAVPCFGGRTRHRSPLHAALAGQACVWSPSQGTRRVSARRPLRFLSERRRGSGRRSERCSRRTAAPAGEE